MSEPKSLRNEAHANMRMGFFESEFIVDINRSFFIDSILNEGYSSNKLRKFSLFMK